MVADGQLKLSTDTLHAAGETRHGLPIVRHLRCPGSRTGEDLPGVGRVVARRRDGRSSHPAAAALGPFQRRGARHPGIHPPALLRPCAGMSAGRPGTSLDSERHRKFSSGSGSKPANKIAAGQPPGAQPSRARPFKTRVMIAGAVLVVAVIVAVLVIGSHHRPSPPAIQSSTPATSLSLQARQPSLATVPSCKAQSLSGQPPTCPKAFATLLRARQSPYRSRGRCQRQCCRRNH